MPEPTAEEIERAIDEAQDNEALFNAISELLEDEPFGRIIHTLVQLLAFTIVGLSAGNRSLAEDGIRLAHTGIREMVREAMDIAEDEIESTVGHA